MKILIVDDDQSINRMVKKILEMESHVVFTAFNGQEAINILNKTPDIQLIITDIIMPEKEGLETIMEIRKKFDDKKILAISGGGKLKAEGYLKLAKQLGADDILAKPFDGDELLSIIEKIVS